MRSLTQMLSKLPQSARFLLAGGFAAGVNWLVRFPLSALMPFPAAVAAAAVIGMAVGFVTYRTFVFQGSSRRIHEQLRDFVLVNAVTMLAVTIAATFIRDALLLVMPSAFAEAIGHALAIMLGAVLNYFAHGAITFQVKDHQTE